MTAGSLRSIEGCLGSSSDGAGNDAGHLKAAYGFGKDGDAEASGYQSKNRFLVDDLLDNLGRRFQLLEQAKYSGYESGHEAVREEDHRFTLQVLRLDFRA